MPEGIYLTFTTVVCEAADLTSSSLSGVLESTETRNAGTSREKGNIVFE
jgi:hypothetical protein